MAVFRNAINADNIPVFKQFYRIFQGELLYKYLLCWNWTIHVEVWSMVMPVLRNTVGVRNPFALAEAKLGKEIDWCNTSAEKKRELIERAFGASYREIFDPRNTNPTFIHPVKSGSGDPNQCDAAIVRSLITGWGKNPLGNIYNEPVGSYGAFDDPVQGALSDCFFIAALSSIAFASNTCQRFFVDIGGSPVTLTFWDGFVNKNGVTYPTVSRTVKVANDHFPLGKNGKLVFARSNTPEELWIAMYEKGYAQWKCGGGSIDEPDYSKLCLGNPVTALANITQYKYSAESVFDTTAFAGDPTMIYTTLAKACDGATKKYPYDRKTYWPAVAYTYDSTALPYSNPTIVRNHSYSILGVHGSGADRYIVLRNPWGQVPPSAILDPALLDKNRCLLDAQGNPVICYGDPNLGPDVLSTKIWRGITNLAEPNDGIFGLHVNAFQKYFQGFGWVFT